MFCGTSNPSPLSAYLADFVKELKELLEHGFEYEKKTLYDKNTQHNM
jgi:hypothetical protein